jgi:hypothetical protein
MGKLGVEKLIQCLEVIGTTLSKKVLIKMVYKKNKRNQLFFAA